MRAFTIVEFSIAIAVATILGAAAIARYNTFLRESEFTSGGQQIANCFERANTQARTSSAANPARFVRATITYDASTPAVNCIVESEPQYRSDGTVITTTSLLQGNPAESTTNLAFTANNARLAIGTTLRVVFGALENGVPLGMSTDGALNRQPDDSLTPSTYVPFGTGFTMDENTNTIRLNSDTSNACGVVNMTPIGSPVSFQALSSCP